MENTTAIALIVTIGYTLDTLIKQIALYCNLRLEIKNTLSKIELQNSEVQLRRKYELDLNEIQNNQELLSNAIKNDHQLSLILLNYK